MPSRPWVLLAYRLPREPSTPRAALWRALRRLGAVQIVDGLVALPDVERTREHFGWLADGVVEAGGEATTWVATFTSPAQERALQARMQEAIVSEYEGLVEAAAAAAAAPELAHREVTRLRRELQRTVARDFSAPPERDAARAAVLRLERAVEAAR